MIVKQVIGVSGLACLLTGTLQAADVYRFRGENAQGKFNETGLLKQWPEGGLEPKWTYTELGAGWGSVRIVRWKNGICVDARWYASR